MRGVAPEGLLRSLPLRTHLIAALFAFALPSVAHAACEPLSGERFGLLIDDAEAAWTRLDTAAFTAGADALAESFPCLSEPTERAVVARYHRLQGLRAFIVRDSARAQAAFAATRSIEPAAGLPTAFAPEGHPLQADFHAIPLDTLTTEQAPPAGNGTLSFDAKVGRDRPKMAPTVFQWRDAEGAVRSTAYVWPDEPLPPYPVRAPHSVRRSLLVGAVAGGVAAAGLAVTSILAEGAYDRTHTPEDAQRLYTLTNTSGGVALGLALAAAGTTVVAFTVPFGD